MTDMLMTAKEYFLSKAKDIAKERGIDMETITEKELLELINEVERRERAERQKVAKRHKGL